MTHTTSLGLILGLVICSLAALGACEDLPCRERDVGIEGRSIVCVCDAEYCDTITREVPDPGTYVVYTSTDAGKRFEKTFGVIETNEAGVDEEEDDEDEDGDIDEEDGDIDGEDSDIDGDLDGEDGDISSGDGDIDIDDELSYFKSYVKRQLLNRNKQGNRDEAEQFDDEFEETIWNKARVRIYTNRRFQFIEGFGGSVTDAAAINWKKLSDRTQVKFINSYFGSEGLEYNLIRVPIAGADFSTHPYTYNEHPWHDAALSNYSLTDEDLFLKLPMIKRAQRAATDEIKITASTWSPPLWMKTNERITGFGQLRTQYYQSFADYHLRFIEEYSKAEVPIWAITTTNEPVNGIIPFVDFNSLGWLPSQLARWVANNLGPTIRNSRFNATKILAVDDQRYMLPVYLYGMRRENPKALDYIDGFAIHYYGNFFPASILSQVHDRYPEKIMLSTEACEGAMPWVREKVAIGSWRRGQNYVKSILQDLNNYVVGWLDWNLCLDPIGGPNWANNFVDAPILVYGENDEFIKQPMFYAMGHFSKFIPRGSRRIRVARRSLLNVENVAVLTPEGNIVMVLQNARDRQIRIQVRVDRTRFINIDMEPNSLKTVEIAI